MILFRMRQSSTSDSTGGQQPKAGVEGSREEEKSPQLNVIDTRPIQTEPSVEIARMAEACVGQLSDEPSVEIARMTEACVGPNDDDGHV